jgi:lipopolysaccharide export LptBFGC system permease protein LptF
MTKKKRRQMRLTLTLSVMIAAIPVSLSLFFNADQQLPTSFKQLNPKAEQPVAGSKIIPILANK